MHWFDEIGFGGEDGRTAERTGLIEVKPCVDAMDVKSMTTERKEAELILWLEFGQTNGAVSGGGGRAGDGRVSEDRERVDDRAGVVMRRNAATGGRAGVGVEDGGGGGEVMEAAAVEMAKEEAERDGEKNSDGENEEDDNDSRFEFIYGRM